MSDIPPVLKIFLLFAVFTFLLNLTKAKVYCFSPASTSFLTKYNIGLTFDLPLNKETVIALNRIQDQTRIVFIKKRQCKAEFSTYIIKCIILFNAIFAEHYIHIF